MIERYNLNMITKEFTRSEDGTLIMYRDHEKEVEDLKEDLEANSLAIANLIKANEDKAVIIKQLREK